MDANQAKRSKIYSYFYGGNTSFQKFIIIIGVFFILMTSVFSTAATQKWNKLREELNETQNIYNEAYYAARNVTNVTKGQPVTVSKEDENYTVLKAYNDALEDYTDIQKEYQEFSKSSFWSKLFVFLGIATILTGLIWLLIKKCSFNKDGESIVDEEIAAKMEEAKKKGLEKLNIIEAQIESVDPVVLNGIAEPNSYASAPRSLKEFFRRIGRTIVRYGKIILVALAALVLMLILNLLAGWGFPAFLLAVLALGIAGATGYLAYKKYEEGSFVNPSIIEQLKKHAPKLIVRPGSDDKIRASLVAYAVYMFGEDQLYVYYQYIDIVTDKVFCEGVHEYFYEDIVGVTSRQDTKVAYKRYGFLNLLVKNVEYLEESISVVTSGATHTEEYVTGIGNSILDTQFTGMRNLIREKKNQK